MNRHPPPQKKIPKSSHPPHPHSPLPTQNEFPDDSHRGKNNLHLPDSVCLSAEVTAVRGKFGGGRRRIEEIQKCISHWPGRPDRECPSTPKNKSLKKTSRSNYNFFETSGRARCFFLCTPEARAGGCCESERKKNRGFRVRDGKKRAANRHFRRRYGGGGRTLVSPTFCNSARKEGIRIYPGNSESAEILTTPDSTVYGREGRWDFVACSGRL